MISVILNWFWVSYNDNNIILLNIIGDKLYYLLDIFFDFFSGYGVYIVNSLNELIYIDKEYNIKKLLMDLKIMIMFLIRV